MLHDKQSGALLRLHAPHMRGPGLIPDQATRSHVPRLRLEAAK